MNQMPGKSSIEAHIEHRLWTQKLKGKRVSTDRLLGEVEYYFFKKTKGVSMSETAKKKVLKLIKKVRKRVKMRWYNHKRKKRNWAEMMGVSVDVVDRLMETGFVKNTWDVKRLIPVVEMIKREN